MKKLVFGVLCALGAVLGADVKQCVNVKLIESYIASRMQVDKEYSHINAIADKEYKGKEMIALDPGVKILTGLLNEDELGNSACWYRFSFKFHDVADKDIQPYMDKVEGVYAEKRKLNSFRGLKAKYTEILKLLRYNEIPDDKIVPYAIIFVDNIFEEYNEVKRTSLIEYPTITKTYYKKFFKGKPAKQDFEVLTTGIETPMKYKCKSPADKSAWYSLSIFTSESDASEIKIDGGVVDAIKYKLRKTDDENCESAYRPVEIVKYPEFKQFVQEHYNDIEIHANVVEISEAFKKNLVNKTAKFTFSFNWDKKYPEIVPIPVKK